MRKAHRPRRLVSDHFQCCEATNPHLSIFSPSKPHPRMTPSSHELSCILKSHAIIARGRTLKLDLCLSNRSKAHVRTADHTKWVGAFHRKEDFVDVVEEKILEELSLEMDTTSNRLNFVQKKVALVMKRASAKGQPMMIAFLVHKQGTALGRSVDLTKFNCYEELFAELDQMFEFDGELMVANKSWMVVYIDNEGDMVLVGDKRC